MARRIQRVRYRGNLPGPLRLYWFRRAGGKFDYHPILAVTCSSRFVTTCVIPGCWRLSTALRTCPENGGNVTASWVRGPAETFPASSRECSSGNYQQAWSKLG